jgi:hypothetical protein
MTNPLSPISVRPGANATSRKPRRQSEFPPLAPILVSVKQAKALLGNMSHDRFWRLATAGAFGPLMGNKQKRYLYYKNLVAYADNLARAPYSKKLEDNTAA